MKDINNYIDAINQYLEIDIKQGKNWTSAVKNLSDYLNEHDFVQNEGMTINDDTIDAFIGRIQNENNNDNLNFLPVNKLEVQPMSKPKVFNNKLLNEYRSFYFDGLNNQHFPKRTLDKDLEQIHAYSDFFKLLFCLRIIANRML